MSAMDETSAFGFAPAAPAQAPAEVADAGEDGEDAAAEEAAAPSESAAVASVAAPPTESGADAASRRVAEAAGSDTATMVAEAAAPQGEPASGSLGTAALARPASAPAVAAFASANRSRESDRSLYASLYNRSEARTPIRNAEVGKSRRVVVHQREGDAGSENALPGVDPKSLFEIGQRASADSDLLDDIGGEYQIASLGGLARLAPSGLLVQRDDIVTNCFGRDLMGLIGQIERRFGEKVVITSGMRSPAHNRRVNGAKASLHMACKAADLHVPGTNGMEVARFVRALPGRGGVGTYCHTAAIHIDTGPKRDWNWPCRRRAG